jgi:hypothetical protein
MNSRQMFTIAMLLFISIAITTTHITALQQIETLDGTSDKALYLVKEDSSILFIAQVKTGSNFVKRKFSVDNLSDKTVLKVWILIYCLSITNIFYIRFILTLFQNQIH